MSIDFSPLERTFFVPPRGWHYRIYLDPTVRALQAVPIDIGMPKLAYYNIHLEICRVYGHVTTTSVVNELKKLEPMLEQLCNCYHGTELDIHGNAVGIWHKNALNILEYVQSLKLNFVRHDIAIPIVNNIER